MATKEFAKTTKEVSALLKTLSTEVPESSNAAEYSKFLQKTLTTAQTFDKSSDTYVDYVARGMKPKKAAVKSQVTEEKPKKATPAPKASEETDAKKRKADAAPKEEKAKQTKKAKSD
jgi:hypothetical protein